MKTLYGVQYLRAVAAVAVVVFHASLRAGYDFAIGQAGVDIFFVISGFLMVAITDERSRPARFMADRVRRIVPLYWLATSVVFAGALAGCFPKIATDPWYSLASYLFLPARSPTSGRLWPLLMPGWTLNYEMAFYALFAVAMALRSQRRQVAAVSLAFIGLALAGALVASRSAAFIFYTNPIILEFLMGCWLGLAWKAAPPWPVWLGWPAIAVAFLCFAAIGATGMDGARLLLLGVPALLLLAGTLGLERREAVAQWRVPLLIGDASYSIYLWHALAISATTRLNTWAGAPPWLALLVGIAAGIMVGLASYRLIEQPIIAFFRARRRRRVAAIAV